MNRSFRHEALLWRDPDEFLETTVPFIRDGLEAGHAVMVAVVDERSRWLHASLGTDADDALFVDMAELGHNPARIIPAWRRFIDEHAADHQAVRGLGEPLWVGRRPEEIVESQLNEALLNVAVEPDIPCWLMCPYDAARLAPEVIEEVYRSHPAVVLGHEYRGSHLYGGRAHVDAIFGTDLPELGGQPIELPFDRDELYRVSGFVANQAFAAGMSVDKAADLAVAVQELVSHSLQRGASHGTIKIVTTADAVICEVHDAVHVSDPLAGRRAATKGNRSGIWLAHHLCDLVQLRSTPGGTTVRLHCWR